MGKKSKRRRSSQNQEASRPAAPLRKAPEASGEETKDNLRFEDPFVEEYDEDEGWEDEEEEAADGGVEVIQSWTPLSGEPLQQGQKLEMDPSAYKMCHSLTAEWPSLSFDFLRDELGESRTRFPHSLIAAVGSQADRPEHNRLTILKMSDLSRTNVETDDDILGEEFNPNKDDESDGSDEESEDEVDLDPVIENYEIKHYGGVNRVRSMPQSPNVVATWSDVGRVNLFDVEPVLARFSLSEGKLPASTKDLPSKPFFSYTGHGCEGYAIDWSIVERGRLVTGDVEGNIHLWAPRPDGAYDVTPSYDTKDSGRTVDEPSSIEDLQWSPTESTVFASAECGGYVRVFDTRAPKAMLSHKIHSNGADVNVLSWNKIVSNLLATGGDDGVLNVWDLRQFSGADIKPLARFSPHKTPITSVEWHPTDESSLAVTDDHGAYVYDLSVEEDDVDVAQSAIPPQILFVHCGSEQFKEVHWHPQISSCLMTTALSGYSIFIPSNL